MNELKLHTAHIMKTIPSIAGIVITCLGTLFLSAQPKYALAQIDTIRVKDHRLNTATLKPGLRQYLVYFQNAKNPKVLRFWFWLRDTKIETRNGEKYLPLPSIGMGAIPLVIVQGIR
jgi:hypothetical protein